MARKRDQEVASAKPLETSELLAQLKRDTDASLRAKPAPPWPERDRPKTTRELNDGLDRGGRCRGKGPEPHVR